MTRLALCMSGQLRESDAALLRLREVMAGLDITLIASLWDATGRKASGALNPDQLARVIDEPSYLMLPWPLMGKPPLRELIAAAQAKLPEVPTGPGVVDARIRAIFPEAIVDIEPSSSLDLELPPGTNDGNSLRMLYKIWRCNEIRRAQEARGGAFDYVLRLRPDMLMRDASLDVIRTRCNEATILVDHVHHDRQRVGDSFAAARPAVMDCYAAGFGQALLSRHAWDSVHALMYQHLAGCGIAMDLFPATQSYVLDAQLTADQLRVVLDEMLAQAPLDNALAVMRRVLHAQAAIAAGAEGRAEAQIAAIVSDDLLGEDSMDCAMIGCAMLLEAQGEPGLALCATLIAAFKRMRFSPFRRPALARLVQQRLSAIDIPEDEAGSNGQRLSELLALQPRPTWMRQMLAGTLAGSRRRATEPLQRVLSEFLASHALASRFLAECAGQPGRPLAVWFMRNAAPGLPGGFGLPGFAPGLHLRMAAALRAAGYAREAELHEAAAKAPQAAAPPPEEDP